MENSEKLLGKEQCKISSPFGWRTSPINQSKEFHNGVDYSTFGKKIPCFAIENAIVQRVSKDKFGGNFVYVKFPELNKVGLYYHLDQITVKEGQQIREGQQIGIVGNTGNSTGVHLHFSLIENNDKALIYNQADYLDFEKFKFGEKKSPQILQEKLQKVILDSKTAEILIIEQNDRSYLKTSELTKLGKTVSYENNTIIIKTTTNP